MNKLNDIKSRLDVALERFSSELKGIQTGRATPLVLDNVYVDAYGSKMQISHLASVNIEDAKTLRVSPYDKSVMRDIEAAINDANLGLSVASDSDGLRVIFPLLTTERRTQYTKLAKEKLEDARVSIRGIREDVKKSIEEGAKESLYGEDDKKRFLDDMQNEIDKANNLCEDIYKKKESEIMGEN